MLLVPLQFVEGGLAGSAAGVELLVGAGLFAVVHGEVVVEHDEHLLNPWKTKEPITDDRTTTGGKTVSKHSLMRRADGNNLYEKRSYHNEFDKTRYAMVKEGHDVMTTRIA